MPSPNLILIVPNQLSNAIISKRVVEFSQKVCGGDKCHSFLCLQCRKFILTNQNNNQALETEINNAEKEDA